MSDDVLAEKEIDLSRLRVTDWSEFIEAAQPVPFEFKDARGKPAGTVYLGFAACTIQVKIFHIENFPQTAGFMDKTDPYVKYAPSPALQIPQTPRPAALPRPSQPQQEGYSGGFTANKKS